MFKLGLSRSAGTLLRDRTAGLIRKRFTYFSSSGLRYCLLESRHLVHPVHLSGFKIYHLSLRAQFRGYRDFLIASFRLEIELYITAVRTATAIPRGEL